MSGGTRGVPEGGILGGPRGGQNGGPRGVFWGVPEGVFWGGPGATPRAPPRGGAKKVTFRRVFNNSPSRDKMGQKKTPIFSDFCILSCSKGKKNAIFPGPENARIFGGGSRGGEISPPAGGRPGGAPPGGGPKRAKNDPPWTPQNTPKNTPFLTPSGTPKLPPVLYPPVMP